MALEDRVLKHLDYLIEEGEKIKPARVEEIGYQDHEIFKPTDYPQWVSQAENFIHNLLGEKSLYLQRFSDYEKVRVGRMTALVSLLRGIKHDYENKVLHDFKTVYVAEVFSDFLEMSQQLLDEGRHDPAAMLIGAVLEDGLRKLCDKKSVAFKKGDQLTTLKDKLLQGRAINSLTAKKLEVWIKLRNHAAHGEFDKYTITDVMEMQKGVSDFVEANL